MFRRGVKKDLKEQVKNHSNSKSEQGNIYSGNEEKIISTGSTLLDLAISGGRVREGGIPTGILVEIFGPSGSGKTALLSEIAGNIYRAGGDILFHDPEARLNKQFAKIFGFDVDKISYTNADTIKEVFSSVREWKPKPKNSQAINAIFADSLAALTTEFEMDKEEGDKMGMRRAKEFSEELRKTCRVLARNDLLMVCSNQVRQNLDGGLYGQKYVSPGGEAIGFYSSLRLRTFSPQKIKKKVKINGKELSRVIGITVQIEVYKSSVWKPYHTATVSILFDYGIDDIRENLQFVKSILKNNVYTVADTKVGVSLEKAILKVEEMGLEKELKQQVIDLWNEVEKEFEIDRKPKLRE